MDNKVGHVNILLVGDVDTSLAQHIYDSFKNVFK